MGTSAERRAWKSMHHRCYHSSDLYFHRYGGRGVYVCQRWHSFDEFAADMGRRPSRLHSVDRMNNDGSYTCGACADCAARQRPMNCRWATAREQTSNRSSTTMLTVRGVQKTMAEWCRIYRIKDNTLCGRLARGWPHEEALETPVGGRRERAA